VEFTNKFGLLYPYFILLKRFFNKFLIIELKSFNILILILNLFQIINFNLISIKKLK
jgi:hypothetical protein